MGKKRGFRSLPRTNAPGGFKAAAEIGASAVGAPPGRVVPNRRLLRSMKKAGRKYASPSSDHFSLRGRRARSSQAFLSHHARAGNLRADVLIRRLNPTVWLSRACIPLTQFLGLFDQVTPPRWKWRARHAGPPSWGMGPAFTTFLLFVF